MHTQIHLDARSLAHSLGRGGEERRCSETRQRIVEVTRKTGGGRLAGGLESAEKIILSIQFRTRFEWI